MAKKKSTKAAKTKKKVKEKKTLKPVVRKANKTSFPPNNKAHQKFKTSEERREAFRQVCDHIASGLSKECLTVCDWNTVEKYLVDYPEDFVREDLNESFRKGQYVWEALGLKGALGRVPNFNATSWIFNMKNRYGWKDKKELQHSGHIESENKDRKKLTGEEAARAYQQAMQEI